ncbi:conserved hypothetical protein [Sporisorium reilianum SRZ2]|uniref:RRM domain-containing protein n=1 Tax=Sporisorium reilianum (strain SRZ2) TaxID=999809 RepID=E6ZQI5_SPORE|nr:conserved hypothetical protein [Sporisorium reilianum SRZ2]
MTDINQSIVDPVANNVQPVTKSDDDDKKVFAGNLAFATTEEQLKALFSEAGTVTHAQIITRGTRSLGYGFVTFSTDAEVQTAIQLLNKRDVAGREISVESAKPQSAAADADKPKARRARYKKDTESSRAPRRARADEGEEGAAEEDAAKATTNGDSATQANGTKPSKSAKRRQKKKAAAAAGANGGESTAAAETKTESSDAKTRAPRAKREPKAAPSGEPSKTLVFVANLAFSTTDESLKAAFADYKVKSAHIVKRRNGNRSKGFGFVDFEDSSEQQRAIASAQGKQIDGREVTLQVAVQNDKAEQQAEAAESAPAAAA